MKNDRIKILALLLFALPLLILTIFRVMPVKAAAHSADDPAVTYKAKCSVCHSPTASKFFDPAKPEAELVQTILKGKKGEKPPYMPAWEDKGVTEGDAKALIGYMKSVRVPAN